MLSKTSRSYRPLRCLFFALLTFFCFSHSSVFSQSTPGSLSQNEEASQGIQNLFDRLSQEKSEETSSGEMGLPTQALVVTGMSMLPFIVMLLTSFTKIVIVMSLLRNAIGVQQAPPNQVLNGMAIILTVYVMAPTALAMFEASQDVIEKYKHSSLVSKDSAAFMYDLVNSSKEPFRSFLKRNSLATHQNSFYRLALRTFPEPFRSDMKQETFIILIPSYISSQIRNAFEIGVLIYLPFFVIDIVTSNVLLAMGMMMMSPMSISLPLKLLLVVMLDGWTLLVQGLVLTYN